MKWKYLEIIKFEFGYKLLVLGVIHPLLSAILDLFVKLFMKESTLFNFDILSLVLHFPGILLVLLYAVVYFVLIYYEYVVLFKMVSLIKQGEEVKWRTVCATSLVEVKLLWNRYAPLAFVYFVLLNPFWHLGYSSSFLPSVTIPNFVTGELIKMKYGGMLLILLYLVLFILFGLLIYVPFYMIGKRQNFIDAMKSSVKKVKQRPKVWLVLIGIFILSRVIDLYAPLYSRMLSVQDFNFYFLRYFVFSSFFRFSVLQFILLSIYWVIVEILFVNYLDEKEFVEAFTEQEVVPDLSGVKNRLILAKRQLSRFRKTCIVLSVMAIAGFVISYFNQFPLVHQPISIGHRGGSIDQVENSIASILEADQFHTDYAEIDVQYTKDKELVVVHDTNLNRLTGKNVELSSLTLDELSAYPMKNEISGEQVKIATLKEVLQAVKEAPNQIGLLIEFKPAEGEGVQMADQTIALVEQAGLEDRTIFMSMDKETVIRMHEQRPEWWIGYCAFGSIGNIHLRLTDRFYPDFLAVEESQLNTQLLENARNNNLPIYVWTVDDPERILDYLRMGVSGIIGDAADQVASTIDEYKQHDENVEYLTMCEGYPRLTDD